MVMLESILIRQVERAIGTPSEQWRNNCHSISLAAVRSGVLADPGPACRVVRGFTKGYGITRQHSWIALGRPFDPFTRIVDLTAHAWGEIEGPVVSTVQESYDNAMHPKVGQGHIAHGYRPGTIWDYGKPDVPGKPVELDRENLSYPARAFLDVLEPQTLEGLIELMTYPHAGWPADEICEAIVEQFPRAEVLLPIDVLGHVTDRNPQNLYW